MNTIVEVVKANVPDDDTRYLIYETIFVAFEQEDWDTQRECIGIDPVFDRLIPDEDDDDMDDDDMDDDDENDDDFDDDDMDDDDDDEG